MNLEKDQQISHEDNNPKFTIERIYDAWKTIPLTQKILHGPDFEFDISLNRYPLLENFSPREIDSFDSLLQRVAILDQISTPKENGDKIDESIQEFLYPFYSRISTFLTKDLNEDEYESEYNKAKERAIKTKEKVFQAFCAILADIPADEAPTLSHSGYIQRIKAKLDSLMDKGIKQEEIDAVLSEVLEEINQPNSVNLKFIQAIWHEAWKDEKFTRNNGIYPPNIIDSLGANSLHTGALYWLGRNIIEIEPDLSMADLKTPPNFTSLHISNVPLRDDNNNTKEVKLILCNNLERLSPGIFTDFCNKEYGKGQWLLVSEDQHGKLMAVRRKNIGEINIKQHEVLTTNLYNSSLFPKDRFPDYYKPGVIPFLQ